MSSRFQLPPKGMTGTIDITPRDPSDPEAMPYIIQTSDPFDMLVEWSLDGPTAACLGGTWSVTLYIDNVDGVGPTIGILDSAEVPVESTPPKPLPRRYQHLFHFDPNPVSEGAYQIIAVVRYQNLNTPLPLRGFADTGIIDFMES